MSSSVRAFVRHALRRHPNKVAAGLSLVMVLAILVAIEAALRAGVAPEVAGNPEPPVDNAFADMVYRDKVFGYRLHVGQQVHDVARREDVVIYDAHYRIDHAGQRVVPGGADDPDAPLLAVFGCSFAFGLGVLDGETVAAQAIGHLHGARGKNFGVPGYGPQHLWILLHDDDVARDLAGARGVAVYLLLQHHLERLSGSPQLDPGWRKSLPWLESEHGEIHHRGTFGQRDRTRPAPSWPWANSKLYQSLRVRLSPIAAPAASPAHSYDAQRALLVDVMRAARARLGEIAPALAFRVVVMPQEKHMQRTVAALESAGIHVWSYVNLDLGTGTVDDLWYRDGPGGVPGHPKPPAYAMVGRQLAADCASLMAVTAESRGDSAQ